MRKRCHRRPVKPLPPPGMRPKLTTTTVRDLSLVHLVNLDAIAKGQADAELLYQWAGGIFTWSKVAELAGAGLPEMQKQLELAEAVLDRYRKTGRVGFSGLEYQLAKEGVDVMDQLAETVDHAVAVKAAEWSEMLINRLAARQGVAA